MKNEEIREIYLYYERESLNSSPGNSNRKAEMIKKEVKKLLEREDEISIVNAYTLIQKLIENLKRDHFTNVCKKHFQIEKRSGRLWIIRSEK